MTVRRGLLLTLLITVAFAPGATAQEKGRTGITMAYPGTFGVIWHATDTIALRPDFGFTAAHNDATTDSDSWTLNTGIGVLFYFAEKDNVRSYFTPRLGYSHGSSTASVSGTDVTSSGNAWTGSGSFGAQYAPNRRFGVFGEFGLAFGWAESQGGSLGGAPQPPKSTSRSWSTRAGVGIIFYP